MRKGATRPASKRQEDVKILYPQEFGGNGMNDLVKETLKKLIKEHGESLCSNINRLKGLLYDACPSYRKEINVLILAVQEGLIAELKKSGISEVYLHSLSSRLHNATGIDKAFAEWSIRTWAEALGIGLFVITKQKKTIIKKLLGGIFDPIGSSFR
jgi:hypothetical protein